MENETNEHERICDARRMALRKSLNELSTWAFEKSKNDIFDTVKVMQQLQSVIDGMNQKLDKVI